MKVGGTILLVLGVLCLCAAAFFGYFSWSNFGSAERLAADLPEGAGFVVRLVEEKAQTQATIAGVSFGGFLLFGVPGILLRRKGQAAPSRLATAA